MKFLILVSITIISFNSLANNFFCSIANDPSASKLRITYEKLKPKSLALKSPGSEEYRPLMMNLKQVVLIDEYESFSATPFLDFQIDWINEPACYKHLGSQWYFEFNHQIKQYQVQIIPYFETSHKTCVPPRLPPQQKKLNCSF